jgi:predicted GNAT family acetyltransferase
MEVVFHRAAGAFRRKAAPLLSGGEVENPLLFGIRHGVGAGDGTLLCTVQDRGRAHAAAVQVPLRPLVLAKAEAEPLELLARGWHRRGLPLASVFGPEESASTFTAAWPGARLVLALSMRSYGLTRVSPPKPVPGLLRAASTGDVPLLTRWATAFIAESGGHPGDPPQVVSAGVNEKRLFVWEDGAELVAMAAWSARTSTSARVNLVYTPPVLRGRGYASACVAAVSQRLLDEGLQRCFLFADRANPVSTAIYQRLGYLPLGDFAEYRIA